MCAICGLTACSDFLEEQVPQATLTQDEVKKPEYIDNVLISAYAGLLSIEDMNSSFSLWNYDTRSDDAYVGGATRSCRVYHCLWTCWLRPTSRTPPSSSVLPR